MYSILYKKLNGYHTHLCDVFSDDELWELIQEGWRLIE